MNGDVLPTEQQIKCSLMANESTSIDRVPLNWIPVPLTPTFPFSLYNSTITNYQPTFMSSHSQAVKSLASTQESAEQI